MKTIALRFSDRFAPYCGTIRAHQELIDIKGMAWYGKLGLPLSDKAIAYVMENEEPRILLVHSGKFERYWAYINDIQHLCPNKEFIPEYYRDITDRFHTWFYVTKFEKADKNILSKSIVLSSGQTLSSASRHSMCPYFIIETEYV